MIVRNSEPKFPVRKFLRIRAQQPQAMLNMLTMDISNHRMRFPPVRGLTRQLRTYTDENDRKGFPQDNVMALAEISYLANFVPESSDTEPAKRANHRNRRAKTTARRRR